MAKVGAAALGMALAAGGLASVAAGHGAVKPRTAPAHPTGGRVALYFTQEGATKSAVVVTGAIGDYGTGVSIDRDGHLDPQGAYERIMLKHGSFTLDARAFQKGVNRTRPSVNPQTCSFVVRGRGGAKVFDGGGAYAGIGGTLIVQSTFATIVPRKGPSDACAFGDSGGLLTQYLSVSAAGRVSF